jgi:quinol monooxygenase YgiN
MRRIVFLLLCGVQLSAQTPANTSFYTVSYVETSSKAMAVTAFKRYRDASAKEAGFVRFELFEQAGRNGHFAVIETWASQGAFDNHQMAAHTKQLASDLQPLRLSDYDQRPYKNLTTAKGAASTNRTVYVISHVDIGGQGSDAPTLLTRLAEASRKEEGNLRFDVLQHAMRANHFTVIEAWQSEKALDAHAAAAHTKQYRESVASILGSPLDERVYNSVE